MNTGGDFETRSLLDPRTAQPAFTGGHYSLVRFVLGLLLFVELLGAARFAIRMYGVLAVPADASWIARYFPNVLDFVHTPEWPAAVCLFTSMLAVLLAIGWYDRFAAVCIWYVLTCMQLQHPAGGNPAMPFVGWLLLLHAIAPPQPYGSFGSRKRTDPRGGWYLPMPLYLSAWYLLTLGYASSGMHHLTSMGWMSGMSLAGYLRSPSFVRFEQISIWAEATPDIVFQAIAWAICVVELAFPILVLSRRARPVAWAWTMVIHQAVLLSMVYDQTNIGMVVLHLLCFDPAWIKPRRSGIDTVFYDGECGMCHGFVRFILAEDWRKRFRFAPLGSRAYRDAVGDEIKVDSVVIQTADGRALTQSTAAAHILHELGGIWAIAADLLVIIPRPLRDTGYVMLARIRRLIARKPKSACPILPDDLRERFLPGADEA